MGVVCIADETAAGCASSRGGGGGGLTCAFVVVGVSNTHFPWRARTPESLQAELLRDEDLGRAFAGRLT